MKYAILGAGQVGLRHAIAFSKIKICKLIGFTEKDKKKSIYFEKEFNTKRYDNIDILINQKPDFIIICLPHNQRVDPIIKCIKANINLLIEKPLCTNLKELRYLYPYLINNKCKISISFVHRYRKELIKTKETILKNKIGKINLIIENMHSYKNPLLPKWIDIKKYSGGGVLMYNAIHSINKIIHLANSKVKKVTVTSNNINKKLKVEDNLIINLTFKNGIVSSLCCTFTPYKIDPIWRTQIFGDKGHIDLNMRKGLVLNSNNKTKEFNYSNYYKKNGLNINFYLQARSFVNSLINNKKPIINEKDGINSILVVDAIYKSLKLNKTINL